MSRAIRLEPNLKPSRFLLMLTHLRFGVCLPWISALRKSVASVSCIAQLTSDRCVTYVKCPDSIYFAINLKKLGLNWHPWISITLRGADFFFLDSVRYIGELIRKLSSLTCVRLIEVIKAGYWVSYTNMADSVSQIILTALVTLRLLMSWKRYWTLGNALVLWVFEGRIGEASLSVFPLAWFCNSWIVCIGLALFRYISSTLILL